jgi:DNA repair exonuclease SbcCD ATPase subunit
MMIGLIEHTEKIEEAMAETQRVLTQRIDELGQLQNWAVQAAVDLQKRADAAIKNLEAERARLQGTQNNLERNAVQAIHDAVRKQSGDIERQTVNALAAPLAQIQQAAGYVRQNMKEVSWLMLSLVFAGGLIVGLMFGYWPLRSSQNNIQEQLNRIEQYQAAQQPAVPAPAAPEPHAPGHKSKAK